MYRCKLLVWLNKQIKILTFEHLLGEAGHLLEETHVGSGGLVGEEGKHHGYVSPIHQLSLQNKQLDEWGRAGLKIQKHHVSDNHTPQRSWNDQLQDYGTV